MCQVFRFQKLEIYEHIGNISNKISKSLTKLSFNDFRFENLPKNIKFVIDYTPLYFSTMTMALDRLNEKLI